MLGGVLGTYSALSALTGILRSGLCRGCVNCPCPVPAEHCSLGYAVGLLFFTLNFKKGLFLVGVTTVPEPGRGLRRV